MNECIDTPGLHYLSKGAIPKAASTLMAKDNYAPILILGPTGTGKSFVKDRILCAAGIDKDRTLHVNCAAFPKDLVESELFGYAKGAFTGARSQGKPGLVEADADVLILDEISALPKSVQAKLLVFLERREFFPVGEIKPKSSNMKILCIANAEPDDQSLRQDLLYRFRIVYVPGLHARRYDVPFLLAHFAPGVTWTKLDLLRMLAYHWPGNVRELKRVAEQVTDHSHELKTRHEGYGVISWFHLSPTGIRGSDFFYPKLGIHKLVAYQRDLPTHLLRDFYGPDLDEFCPRLSFVEGTEEYCVTLSPPGEPNSNEMPDDQGWKWEWDSWCLLFHQDPKINEDIFGCLARGEITKHWPDFLYTRGRDEEQRQRFFALSRVSKLVLRAWNKRQTGQGEAGASNGEQERFADGDDIEESALQIVLDKYDPPKYRNLWEEYYEKKDMRAGVIAKKFGLDPKLVAQWFRRRKTRTQKAD